MARQERGKKSLNIKRGSVSEALYLRLREVMSVQQIGVLRKRADCRREELMITEGLCSGTVKF